MGGFNFINPVGAPPQAQPQPGPVGTMPAGQTNTQDPQSIYLQQALASMGKQQQGSPMGLGSNLLADALDQYALKQRQAQMAPTPQMADPGLGGGNDALNGNMGIPQISQSQLAAIFGGGG